MRLYRLFPAAFLLFAGMAAMAAPDADAPQNQDRASAQALADLCTKMVCRKAGKTITLRAPGGYVARLKAPVYPYLDSKGVVLLYPGETITLALAKSGDALELPRLLKVIDSDGPVDLGALPPSDSTVSFQLLQNAGDSGMKLLVINSTAMRLKYDAEIFVPTSAGIRSQHSSACLLLAPQGSAKSFFNAESWPYPILMLAVANIRTQAADASNDCN